MKLIGPFVEIVTLKDPNKKGALTDDDLLIYKNAHVLIDAGVIKAIGDLDVLDKQASAAIRVPITSAQVLLPGFVDCHTHICFGGQRARDYAIRLAGKSYQDIAKEGGGILDTVRQTRAASKDKLLSSLNKRIQEHVKRGVTTCEVKSGYGLDVKNELKMLRVIKEANESKAIDLVASCLAAHTVPPEFKGQEQAYLNHIVAEILPVIKKENLGKRVDIFVEEGAFSVPLARAYLQSAKDLGFDLVVHGDQFSTGGSALACELQAVSVDHLEHSSAKEILLLSDSNVIATVLPGASLGLGEPWAPARALLDAGCVVAIASDWNPGSAPMGHLLLQACVLGAAQKLSIAETLAGITNRAAQALNLKDRGVLKESFLADMVSFECQDHREIFWRQGALRPVQVWKQGEALL